MIIQERLLKIIRDDNYAAGFQSLGQYRTALLQAARGEVEPAAVQGEPVDSTAIQEAKEWVRVNEATPAEFLSYHLLVKRSELLGRKLTWAETIELSALTTSMSEEEKARLLELGDPQPAPDVEALVEALKFYADGDHLMFSDKDAWDTVTGEPPNLLCDEAGTATVEDGSIARHAIAAHRKQGGEA